MVLHACSISGDKSNALKVFEMMLSRSGGGIKVGVKAWDALINAFAEARDVGGAFKTLRRMREECNLAPQRSTYDIILKACVRGANFDAAQFIFKQMRQRHIRPDLSCYSNLMKCAVNARCFKDAERYLLEWRGGLSDEVLAFSEPRLYNIMMGAYLDKMNSVENVDRVFRALLSSGIPPDNVSFILAIKAAALSKDEEKALNILE